MPIEETLETIRKKLSPLDEIIQTLPDNTYYQIRFYAEEKHKTNGWWTVLIDVDMSTKFFGLKITPSIGSVADLEAIARAKTVIEEHGLSFY